MTGRRHGSRARDTWLEHYSHIPEGCIIHHIDGNSSNDSIENLLCMSPKAHGILHQNQGDLHNGSETITRVYGTRPEDFVEL